MFAAMRDCASVLRYCVHEESSEVLLKLLEDHVLLHMDEVRGCYMHSTVHIRTYVYNMIGDMLDTFVCTILTVTYL